MTPMVRFEAVGLRYGRAGQGTNAEAGPEVLHDLSFALPDGALREHLPFREAEYRRQFLSLYS